MGWVGTLNGIIIAPPLGLGGGWARSVGEVWGGLDILYGLHLPGGGMGVGPIYELAHLQELAHSNLAHSIGKQ